MKKDESDSFKEFEIPSNFFDKLFEFTGSDESSRGFIIAYVAQDGCPIIYSKIVSPVVEMGLRKALEKYLKEIEKEEKGIDMSE